MEHTSLFYDRKYSSMHTDQIRNEAKTELDNVEKRRRMDGRRRRQMVIAFYLCSQIGDSAIHSRAIYDGAVMKQ